MPSHYEILEVNKNANENEIKKAYRSLSLKYHPDRNSSEEAKVKILQINEAYEILGDNEQKQQYDNKLNGVSRPMHFGNMNANFGNMNDIFSQMFNGMNVHSGMPNVQVFRDGNSTTHIFTSSTSMVKPQLITKTIEISLEQAYSGCTMPIEVETWIQTENNRQMKKEQYMIEIPEGINDNETIIMKDIGNQNQQLKGDVKIIIRIINTTEFKRINMNLQCDKNISLKDALCGFSFEFVHINGKKLAMNNTNPITIIKEGHQQVFNGLGMKCGNRVGNLIFKFNVEFPTNLTDEQRTNITKCLP
tara:strand:- start:8993 stop:9904 length:912 start_codon:yes stop_codon:yes gene_type:complete